VSRGFVILWAMVKEPGPEQTTLEMWRSRAGSCRSPAAQDRSSDRLIVHPWVDGAASLSRSPKGWRSVASSASPVIGSRRGPSRGWCAGAASDGSGSRMTTAVLKSAIGTLSPILPSAGSARCAPPAPPPQKRRGLSAIWGRAPG